MHQRILLTLLLLSPLSLNAMAMDDDGGGTGNINGGGAQLTAPLLPRSPATDNHSRSVSPAQSAHDGDDGSASSTLNDNQDAFSRDENARIVLPAYSPDHPFTLLSPLPPPPHATSSAENKNSNHQESCNVYLLSCIPILRWTKESSGTDATKGSNNVKENEAEQMRRMMALYHEAQELARNQGYEIHHGQVPIKDIEDIRRELPNHQGFPFFKDVRASATTSTDTDKDK